MKTVWITGGGSGIGKALAQRCYERGDHVVITGRRPEPLAQAIKDISGQATSDRLWMFAGDAADAQHAAQVVTALGAQGLFVDVLINSAGQNDNRAFDETTTAEFETAFRVNCLTAVECVKAVLPDMRRRRSGAIVAISSVLGRWGSSGSASYSVSKYATTGLIDVLRQELIDTGIHVLGVFPGFVQTDMTLPFVTPGSLKSRFGKTPLQMADALLGALEGGRAELYYPFYVSWLLRLHRWAPVWADTLARRLHHGR